MEYFSQLIFHNSMKLMSLCLTYVLYVAEKVYIVNNNNIIIMVIFKCYFSGELIALSY